MSVASPFEQLFRDYATAFNAFDAERIAAYYHCPCLMVTDELVTSFPTDDAILENMRALLEHHRAQDVGRAEISDLRLDLQSESLAIVRIQWNVHDRKDAPLWSWFNSYNLVDHGSGWKILVSTTHAVNEAGDLVRRTD